MNDKTTEAYNYYKKQHTPFIIFFRVGDSYRAFFEDASKISALTGSPMADEAVAFPCGRILDVVALLAEKGLMSKIISVRNETGEFAIPDVKNIDMESEMDY